MKRIATTMVLAAALAGGCYKTQYHLTAPAPVAQMGAEKFHLGVIGIIELSSPIDLTGECGGTQAVMVDERVSVLGGVVNMVLGYFVPILHIHNASVGCGAGGAAPTGAPPMGDPNAAPPADPNAAPPAP